MNIIRQEETRFYDYVEIGGKKFRAQEVNEVLEALEETSPGMVHILIQDDELEEALYAEQVVWKSVRGSVAAGPKFDQFKAEFDAAYNQD
jgi:hypothetical protein